MILSGLRTMVPLQQLTFAAVVRRNAAPGNGSRMALALALALTLTQALAQILPCSPFPLAAPTPTLLPSDDENNASAADDAPNIVAAAPSEEPIGVVGGGRPNR